MRGCLCCLEVMLVMVVVMVLLGDGGNAEGDGNSICYWWYWWLRWLCIDVCEDRHGDSLSMVVVVVLVLSATCSTHQELHGGVLAVSGRMTVAE